MERTCKHGYHECRRCVDEADERARQVAKHYADELEREQERSIRPGQNMYYPDLMLRCACGSRLQAPEAKATGRCHYCRTGATRPWDSRCKCGSGLMGKESISTGQCSHCRLGELNLAGPAKRWDPRPYDDWWDE